MPHHVTDEQRDAAVGQRDRVEPVAAGRLLLPGHQVPGRDPGPRQDRQGGWQQRFLQFRHYPVGGPLPGHAVGDVGGDDQEPVDRAVGGPARHHREVRVHLGLPGRVHPVEHFVRWFGG